MNEFEMRELVRDFLWGITQVELTESNQTRKLAASIVWLVFNQIYSYTTRTGCLATYQTIAADSRSDVRTVRRAIKFLRDNGFLVGEGTDVQICWSKIASGIESGKFSKRPKVKG